MRRLLNREERIGLLKNNIGLRIVVIAFASFMMATNINTFVHTAGLFPGGATGLTLLIQEVFSKYFSITVPYTAINVLINSIPIYIGFKYIGKKFTLLSCGFIVLTSILTDFIPAYIITQDILLISIFGGMLNGVAISICLLMDATSGGTDFVAIYLSEKRGIDSFNVILFINACILAAAGVLFGWDKALYSIIFQFASTATIHVLYRKYQQVTFFIVTTKPDEICRAIYAVTNHGATILEGEGSYSHCERNVVYSVVSSAESGRVANVVKETDPEAFLNMFKTDRVIGQFYHRPTD
ncbi:MAG: YitT family protein [Lachnospiraceae bacterium]|nr:YitT family protein [Lachnospiraceae bacterium]